MTKLVKSKTPKQNREPKTGNTQQRLPLIIHLYYAMSGLNDPYRQVVRLFNSWDRFKKKTLPHSCTAQSFLQFVIKLNARYRFVICDISDGSRALPLLTFITAACLFHSPRTVYKRLSNKIAQINVP